MSRRVLYIIGIILIIAILPFLGFSSNVEDRAITFLSVFAAFLVYLNERKKITCSECLPSETHESFEENTPLFTGDVPFTNDHERQNHETL